MAEVSARLRRRIEVDFPHQADRVAGLLADLAHELGWSDGADRLQAAALIIANGDLRRLDYALELARTDWRDLLVGAGLAHDNWPEILKTELP